MSYVIPVGLAFFSVLLSLWMLYPTASWLFVECANWCPRVLFIVRANWCPRVLLSAQIGVRVFYCLRKLVSAQIGVRVFYCLRVLLSAQIVVRVFVVPANCCARVLLEPLLFPYSYN